MRMSVLGMKSYALAINIIFVVKYLPVVARCPVNWEEYAGGCYVYVKQRTHFIDAMTFCNKEGAELLEISSDLENAFAVSLVKRHKGDRVWLGITDLMEEGRWVSINTGNPITYSNWRPNEPNNAYGHEGCGELWDGRWNDSPCSITLQYVCEIQAE